MSRSTLHLVTDDDMRAITSQNLDAIQRLPFLYVATDEGDVMRSWGVAHAARCQCNFDAGIPRASQRHYISLRRPAPTRMDGLFCLITALSRL